MSTRGSHVERAGMQVTGERTRTAIPTNGQIAREIFSRESRSTEQTTQNDAPTRGVIRPITALRTNTVPKWTADQADHDPRAAAPCCSSAMTAVKKRDPTITPCRPPTPSGGAARARARAG